MSNAPFITVVASVAATCILAVWIVPRESKEQTETRLYVESLFSPTISPTMLKVRRAIDDDRDATDEDLLRWFSMAQTGTTAERRAASDLFLGLAIDWPVPRVKQHRATLAHIAGELLATWDGDESIAWAGLAIACEVGSKDSIRDLADAVDRSAKSEIWKTLYAEAYSK